MMATYRLTKPQHDNAPNGALLQRALEHVVTTGDDVVIDVDQRTVAVLISPDAYIDLQRTRERDRRRRLVADLDREALESGGQPRDVSDEELEDVAVELGKEINARIAERLSAEAWRRKRSDVD